MTEKELRDQVEDILTDVEEAKRDSLLDPSWMRHEQVDYLSKIMGLIKANYWPKGEQELPRNPFRRDHKFGIYEEAQQKIVEAGWKPCKEWEK